MLWTIILGLVIGVIAKTIMGRSMGWIWSILLGLAGGAVGGWVYSLFGASVGDSLWGQLVSGVIGSCILLLIFGSFFAKKK